MSPRVFWPVGICLLLIGVLNAPVSSEALAQEQRDHEERNHQIRREKFDMVLPEVMRSNDVDMWIHVMREAIPDPFGAEEFGSTSGVFVFTDPTTTPSSI